MRVLDHGGGLDPRRLIPIEEDGERPLSGCCVTAKIIYPLGEGKREERKWVIFDVPFGKEWVLFP